MDTPPVPDPDDEIFLLEEELGDEPGEFDPPLISIAHLANDITYDQTTDVIRAFTQAWDGLCRNPAWLNWYEAHSDAMHPRLDSNYLAIEDRLDTTFVTKRRKGLEAHLPAHEILKTDPVPYLTRFLVEYYTRRAALSGVPGPPCLD